MRGMAEEFGGWMGRGGKGGSSNAKGGSLIRIPTWGEQHIWMKRKIRDRGGGENHERISEKRWICHLI